MGLRRSVSAARLLPWAIPALFVALSLVAFLQAHVRFAALAGVKSTLLHITYEEIYSRTVLASNYFNDGFVRRGLGGTIATLLSPRWNASTLLFIVFSFAFLVAPLAVLVRRLARTLSRTQASYIAIVLAISPQAFLGWGRDPSRTDLFIAGCLAIGVIAWLDRRRLVAVLCVLFGLLAHETAVVFGLPLLAAMAFADLRTGDLDVQRVLRLLAIAGLGIISILVLQSLFGAPGPVVAEHMLSQAPSLHYDPEHRLWRDIAIYMAVAGPDALKTAICYNLEMNPQYWVQFVQCLVVLTLYTLILPLRRTPLTVALVMLVPAVFMMLIANDTGRWLKLAVLNGWLIASFYLIRGNHLDTLSSRWMVLGGALLVFLLAMGTTRHNKINPALDGLSSHMGFPKPPSLEEWMSNCDPDWRRYVYGQSAQTAAPDVLPRR